METVYAASAVQTEPTFTENENRISTVNAAKNKKSEFISGAEMLSVPSCSLSDNHEPSVAEGLLARIDREIQRSERVSYATGFFLLMCLYNGVVPYSVNLTNSVPFFYRFFF